MLMKCELLMVYVLKVTQATEKLWVAESPDPSSINPPGSNDSVIQDKADSEDDEDGMLFDDYGMPMFPGQQQQKRALSSQSSMKKQQFISVNPLDDEDIWLEDEANNQLVKFARSGSNSWFGMSRTGSVRHLLQINPYSGQVRGSTLSTPP